MPTSDERISTLEFDLKQFKTETLKAYTDMAYEVTILKGLGEDSIKRLAALQREMHERFDTLQNDIRYVRASVDERFKSLNDRLDTIVGSLAVIQQSLDKGE